MIGSMDGSKPHQCLATELLSEFSRRLEVDEPLLHIANDLVGSDSKIVGPFGAKALVYADYVASGRALWSVERFIVDKVLPFYANSHTEASYCGAFMTALRQASRKVIAECCEAHDQHSVIFTGSGATAGLNRLVSLLGVK
jgi:selenocysteine lyase/cysteine desulfurase